MLTESVINADKKREFCELKNGEVFWMDNNLFMKCIPFEGECYIAVRLSTGLIVKVRACEKVVRVDGKFIFQT